MAVYKVHSITYFSIAFGQNTGQLLNLVDHVLNKWNCGYFKRMLSNKTIYNSISILTEKSGVDFDFNLLPLQINQILNHLFPLFLNVMVLFLVCNFSLFPVPVIDFVKDTSFKLISFHVTYFQPSWA